MNQELRNEFDSRMGQAKAHFKQGDFARAFFLLEEAHILGQRYVIPHTLSHFWMLRVGLKRKDLKEIRGQLLRISFGGLFSLIGIAPIGNTGGANISSLKPLPIPAHLKQILDKD